MRPPECREAVLRQKHRSIRRVRLKPPDQYDCHRAISHPIRNKRSKRKDRLPGMASFDRIEHLSPGLDCHFGNTWRETRLANSLDCQNWLRSRRHIRNEVGHVCHSGRIGFVRRPPDGAVAVPFTDGRQ